MLVSHFVSAVALGAKLFVWDCPVKQPTSQGLEVMLDRDTVDFWLSTRDRYYRRQYRVLSILPIRGRFRSAPSPLLSAGRRSSELEHYGQGLISDLWGLSFLFGCRLAPKGNLFEVPQSLQVTTRTSAQGFRPPRLLFSSMLDDVDPGIRGLSQWLQKACFMRGESLRTLLQDIARM